MTSIKKLKERLYTFPKDFTWNELVRVLTSYGYEELKSGGTSARKFRDERSHIINLHKPHPGSIVKSYAIRYVVEELKAKDKEIEAQEEKEREAQTKSRKK
jgi:hypothetical protein